MSSPETPNQPHGSQGFWRRIPEVISSVITMIGALYCFGVHQWIGISFFVEQYSSLMLTLVLALVFLTARGKAAATAPPPWYDLIFVFASLVVGGYLTLEYPAINLRQGFIDAWTVFFGLIALLLILESVRRLTGWVLVFVALAMIFYSLFSNFFPGILNVSPVRWDRLAQYLYVDANALVGMPLNLTLDTILPFLLLGSLLFAIGGGEFFVNVALAAFGRVRGGPAKVAVVASASFGTISGSSVANVATTGAVTIPLMKSVGYSPTLSGAIEAIASTGGQLMPPVMGLTAFLIADFLNIPYRQVAVAALFPAILYYTCVYVQVDREAAKGRFQKLSRSELPKFVSVLKDGWIFVTPFIVLIYALFSLNMQPGRAGMWAVLFTAGIGVLKRKSRDRLKTSLFQILDSTGRTVMQLAVITAMAGIIIGLVSVGALGSILSIQIIRLSGENLFVLLLLVASASIVLGMGMPTAAAYVLLAVTIAPSLVEIGLQPLAAHLFIFYFGVISMITPPICLSAFAGAAIAGAPAMQTGYAAVRLGIVAYLVPFIFVYSPELLMQGPVLRIIAALVTAIIGTAMVGIGLSGYCRTKMGWGRRVLTVLGGAALLLPPGGGIPHSVLINVVGGLLTVGFIVYSATRKITTIPAPGEG